MPQTKEERLEKRRAWWANRTPEQKEHYQSYAKVSNVRNKEVRNKYSLERYRADPVASYERRVQYCRNNPERYLVMIAKCRAKRLGVEFRITAEDIHIPDCCPILGYKLGPVMIAKADRDYTPSVDRIDNSKGYIPGNIKVISYKANRYKSDLSLEQIENLYNYIKVK